MNQGKLAKAAKALMSMGQVKHERPKKPTKRDMQRRFKLRVDRKGKPSITEVG
jgi:hypothetical protein